MYAGIRRHPALVAIGEEEGHAFWVAFQSGHDEFVARASRFVPVDRADRFGRGFRRFLKEEFLPHTKWGVLYCELARVGLETLSGNLSLPCGHDKAYHAGLLRKIIGIVNPVQSRN